jgi:hypothetical protein
MEQHEFIEQELKIVSHMFDVQKAIYPMAVLVKDDTRYQIPVTFQNNAHKDIVSQGIKDLVKKSEPDVVVYVAEAWMLAITSTSDRLPIPSRHPDRIEIVAVQIEFKTGEKFGCQARILRGNGQPRLDKFEVLRDDTSMGRFCDFFPIGRTN